ncbi:MAG: tetratricopeptide repeat protein [Verrucomicrobiae bacterium]|nr:tetratricopeptide repeat protein [Verrucomicrobiae bacterium]
MKWLWATNGPPRAARLAGVWKAGLVLAGVALVAVALALGKGTGRGFGWGAGGLDRKVPLPVALDWAAMDPLVGGHLEDLWRGAVEVRGDAVRRSELGLALAVNGLWAEARQCFVEAIRLGEKGPLPGLYGAVALSEAGDLEGAVVELEQVLTRHPEHAPSWHRLGRLRMGLGDEAGAEEAFAKVTALAPEAWHGWAGLGDARLRAGRVEEAIEVLERAIALDPYARSARHRLGQAYQRAGRAEAAGLELTAGMAATLTPMPDEWSLAALGHMKALPDQFEAADTLMAQGRTGEAVRQLRGVYQVHPDNAAVAARLGLALVADGQAEAAWNLLMAALAGRPGEVGLLMAASRVAVERGMTDRGLALAQEAVLRAPRLAEAHVAVANAWIGREDDAEAVAALERAIELAPGSVELRLQLGDVLRFNLGRVEEAQGQYRRAWERDPIHPVALERLASVEIERGNWEGAMGRVRALERLGIDREAVAALKAELAAARGDPK